MRIQSFSIIVLTLLCLSSCEKTGSISSCSNEFLQLDIENPSFESYLSVNQLFDDDLIVGGRITRKVFYEGYEDSIYVKQPKLVKSDCQGNVEWEKVYTGFFEASYGDVIQTNDNGFLAVGTHRVEYGDPYLYVFIHKLNEEGEVQWYYDTNMISTSGIGLQNSHGNYYITIPYQQKVICLNEQGSLLYEIDCPVISMATIPETIIELSDGGILIGCTVDGFIEERDMFLMKISAEGSLEWSHTYENQDYYDEHVRSLVENDDGTIMVLGDARSNLIGRAQIMLLKLDSNGNKIYEKVYLGSNKQDYADVIVKSNDGYIISGNSDDGFFYNALLMEVNETGNNVIWFKNFSFEGIYSNISTDLIRTHEDQFIVSGYVDRYNGLGTRPFLVQVKGSGYFGGLGIE
jgi:hypothetical protein